MSSLVSSCSRSRTFQTAIAPDDLPLRRLPAMAAVVTAHHLPSAHGLAMVYANAFFPASSPHGRIRPSGLFRRHHQIVSELSRTGDLHDRLRLPRLLFDDTLGAQVPSRPLRSQEGV